MILQRVFLTQVAAFQQLQLGNLNVQVHLLLDVRIAGGQCLDLGVGQNGIVHIFGHANRRPAGENLRDEFLLGFHQLIQVSVKGVLADVGGQTHLRVLVALPHNTSMPLL